MADTTVFISHYSAERAIAEQFQEYLRLRFGKDLEVFRSSDHWSIPTGKPQYSKIIDALSSAKVYILLLSEYSCSRPWVNFEAGFAECRRSANGAEIFPILIRSARADKVPSPLREMQLRPLQPSVLSEIVDAVHSATCLTVQPGDDNGFLARIKSEESRLGDWGLHLVPFRAGQNGSELRFELIYAGPRPVLLTKIWAEVDAGLVNFQRGPMPHIPGHLHNSTITDPDTGRSVLRRELIANLAPPAHGASAMYQPLQRTLNSLVRPMVLDQMKFGYLEFGSSPDSVVRYCVETEDGLLGPFEKKVNELETRP